jgi:S-DNA-T family DNA segregation ATPase FtsK/SpoIIIE
LPQARAYPPPPSAPNPWGQQPLWDNGPFAQAETRADGEDELLDEAIKAVREMKKASISMLQRRLRIGYTRSARLIDALEERGIIGPAESGAKPREVIDYGSGAVPGPDLPDNSTAGDEDDAATSEE